MPRFLVLTYLICMLAEHKISNTNNLLVSPILRKSGQILKKEKKLEKMYFFKDLYLSCLLPTPGEAKAKAMPGRFPIRGSEL